MDPDDLREVISAYQQMQRAAGLAHDDAPGARLDKLDALLAKTSTSIEGVT
jgi:hypothetical protein